MSLEPIPPPTSYSRLGRAGGAIAIVILVGLAVVGGASFLGRQIGGSFQADSSEDGIEVEPGLDVEVVIPSGASGQDIAAILAAQGVVSSATQFEAAVRASGAASSLRAGTYQLVTGMDSSEVIAALTQGPAENVVRVTVREGLRVDEIIAALAEVTQIDEAEFITALEGGGVTTSLKEMPQEATLADWEGLLFPDTYDFSRAATPAQILQRLSSTMEQRVAGVDWAAFEAAGFEVYEGIVIASLIESEVRVAEERPIVSSVIRNRLTDGIALQIDATVLYALDTRDPAEFDREIDSPFNTYLYPGLPPAPISAPRLASLEAAAAPDDTPFYYYVLSDADGSHTFSETLEEHNAAVEQARDEGILP